jgi:hypothetical protein
LAFYCTIPGGCRYPDCDADQNEIAVYAHVGYDDSEGRNYILFAGFSPAAAGLIEYYFYLAEVQEGSDVEYPIFRSSEVAQIIGRKDRQRIMAQLLFNTSVLLERRRPDRFFMNTYEAFMPPVALAKFERLCHLFRQRGYAVAGPEEAGGHHLWWAELPAAQT